MDHTQDPSQESLDKARELLHRTVEALSRAKRPDTGRHDPRGLQGLRELVEALRKIPAPTNDENRAA